MKYNYLSIPNLKGGFPDSKIHGANMGPIRASLTVVKMR